MAFERVTIEELAAITSDIQDAMGKLVASHDMIATSALDPAAKLAFFAHTEVLGKLASHLGRVVGALSAYLLDQDTLESLGSPDSDLGVSDSD